MQGAEAWKQPQEHYETKKQYIGNKEKLLFEACMQLNIILVNEGIVIDCRNSRHLSLFPTAATSQLVLKWPRKINEWKHKIYNK